MRTLHERTDGVPLFVASLMTDVIMRTSSGDDGNAQARVVPQNLTAIIDHYIAKLANEERALLSAAAVCGVEFRVNTIADVLSAMPSVAQMCDQLVREQLWLTAPRPRDESSAPSCRIRSGTRSFARCCTSARRLGAHAAPSQGRRCARTGACGRFARSRDRACAALRTRSRADDGFALLRRSR